MSERVQPGQVWADNDWRMEGRTVRIDRITAATHGTRLYAICTVLSDRKSAVMTQVGKTVQIRLDRFRPTSTGYRLLTPTTHPDDAHPAAPIADDCLPERVEESAE